MTQNPRPTPAVPGSLPAAPVDPLAQAQARIDAAVDALEASRVAGLDAQLEAAEQVHVVLAEHLTGHP